MNDFHDVLTRAADETNPTFLSGLGTFLLLAARLPFPVLWPAIAELLQEFGDAPEGSELYRVQACTEGARLEIAQFPGIPPRALGYDKASATIQQNEVAVIVPTWKWSPRGRHWGWSEEVRTVAFWEERGS